MWSSDSEARLPLGGLIAAPVACAVLAEIDAGRLGLSERLHLTEMDLSPPPSAIDAAFPTPPAGRSLDLPVVDVLALAVQRDDNTAIDVLMKRVGGPGAVTAWLRQKGVNDMRIDRYRREVLQETAGLAPFRPEWKDPGALAAARAAVPPAGRQAAMERFLVDPRDTSTVPAILNLLEQLASGALLAAPSAALLQRLLAGGPDGKAAARGLGRDWRAAALTDPGMTDLGYTPAAGRLALLTAPDGRRFAFAALLAGSTATPHGRDLLFDRAARLLAGAG